MSVATDGSWTCSPTSYTYEWFQDQDGTVTPYGTGASITTPTEDCSGGVREYRLRVTAHSADGGSSSAYASNVHECIWL